MHILIQSNYTYSVNLHSDVSVAVTTIIRDENTPDQKTPLLQGVCLVTHRYISRPPSTQSCLCHTSHVLVLYVLSETLISLRHSRAVN